jgi:hypothetical protein
MELEAFEDEPPVRIFVTETPRVAGFVWDAHGKAQVMFNC